MTTIQAKPTLYQGTRFRSRLEARWARFFDAIGREWIYEPVLPELAKLQYQPDFLTTAPGNSGMSLLEVKPLVDGPQVAKLINDDKWHQVADLAQCKFILLLGTPGEWLEGKLTDGGHMAIRYDPNRSDMALYGFAECLICNSVALWADGVATCHPILPTGPLYEAYEAVRDQSWTA